MPDSLIAAIGPVAMFAGIAICLSVFCVGAASVVANWLEATF